MFILIPIVIIFLALSYLQLNPDVSLVVEIFVYFLILGVIIISVLITKAIKRDLKKQDYNQTILEISRLKEELQHTSNTQRILGLKNEISKLEEEIK